MSDHKAASRYAKSIIGLAQEQQSLEAIKNDMVLFDQIVGQHPELEAILKNPIISKDKKFGILNELLKDKVNTLTLIFFKLTISKGRASVLYAAAKEVLLQYNLINGIEVVTLTSASALSESTKNEISQRIKSTLPIKEVIFKEVIDENLIGGFIIKIGDKQYDASVSGKFKKIKKELNVA